MRAEIRRERMQRIENHRAEVRNSSRTGKNIGSRNAANVKGGKDTATPGVKKIQNVKGDQNLGKNPVVKKDQNIAKVGPKSSQGKSMVGNQQVKKDNQPQARQQVQKQPQPGQQMQRQPQAGQQMQRQPQMQKQQQQPQSQKKAPAKKADDKKKQ